MAFEKVVVPFDWSEPAYRALDNAIEIVKRSPDAKLYIFNVVPAYTINPKQGFGLSSTNAFFNTKEYVAIVDTLMNEAQEAIRDALYDVLSGFENEVEVHCTASDSPASAIVDFAESNEADLIVIGRRGLGALAGMLGSVSYGVLRSTEISVLTVR